MPGQDKRGGHCGLGQGVVRLGRDGHHVRKRLEEVGIK
jgi:hypothetical protein